jgi:hypothetical protein
MLFLRMKSRIIALPLIALMLAVSMPLNVARAALVSTDEVVAPSQAGADRARVAAFIAREDVQAELRRMGVDPNEAAARVAVMSDVEIQKIANRIDEMPAGQSAIGALIGAVVLIFIVLLVTDLLGLTDVYPFVKRNK